MKKNRELLSKKKKGSHFSQIYPVSLDDYFSTRTNFVPKDIWYCMELLLAVTLEKGLRNLVVKAKDAAPWPTTHKPTLHNKELPSLKGQLYWGSEALV